MAGMGCRRTKGLEPGEKKKETSNSILLKIDDTGLNVYG